MEIESLSLPDIFVESAEGDARFGKEQHRFNFMQCISHSL